METPAVVEFLKSRVPLMREMPEERLRDLVSRSRVARFDPNEGIIEFGEPGRFVGVILDGTAEASIADDAGDRRVIATLDPGDVVGEMSVMTGDPAVANVVGVTPCTVLIIPEQVFTTAIASHPQAVKAVSKMIADRVRQLQTERPDGRLAAAAFQKSDDPMGLKLRSESPMAVLVLMCAPTHLRYALFHTRDERLRLVGKVEGLGTGKAVHVHRSPRGETRRVLAESSLAAAFDGMTQAITSPETGLVKSTDEIAAVGHRVVHGWDRYSHPVALSDEVVADLDSMAHLAPIHNPANILGIREARSRWPAAVHVAVFDTAFHHTLPPYAYLYGLPLEYAETKRIRRYGFHGNSHGYVSLKAASFLKRRYNELEVITCHLGAGASLCAVDHGRSVDTSMGFSPAEGLIMSTRCGSIDPAILLYLMRNEGATEQSLQDLINRRSGLLGLSGISDDMQAIEQAATEGNPRALITIKTFCYQVRKYIGAYVAAMGGLDVLVFTGGIGQGSPGVRSLSCQGLGFMGIKLDEERNRNAFGVEEAVDVAADDAPVRVLVIPAEEEAMIARETLRVLGREHVARLLLSQKQLPIPLEVSAHHVHLSLGHVEALFGAGHSLTPEHELSQTGQFASAEKVSLIGPKGRVDRVRVLGPARKETQVEISLTEQFILGIHPPIRESGDIKGSPGITLEGPAGKVAMDKGVICAMRHIHMTPEDALRLGLRDKDVVRVRVEGDREIVFGDVVVRVNPSYRLAMHIDTDEGNAGNIRTGHLGYIDGIQSRA